MSGEKLFITSPFISHQRAKPLACCLCSSIQQKCYQTESWHTQAETRTATRALACMANLREHPYVRARNCAGFVEALHSMGQCNGAHKLRPVCSS